MSFGCFAWLAPVNNTLLPQKPEMRRRYTGEWGRIVCFCSLESISTNRKLNETTYVHHGQTKTQKGGFFLSSGPTERQSFCPSELTRNISWFPSDVLRLLCWNSCCFMEFPEAQMLYLLWTYPLTDWCGSRRLNTAFESNLSTQRIQYQFTTCGSCC